MIDRAWFARDAPVVAPALLNALLSVEVDGVHCVGRIIETEAYMPDDPASHTFRGPTKRNAAMFGPPGHLYVYLSYGIHHCVNVVTGPVGSGQAVLVRAVEPVAGIEVMRERRAGRPDRDLANGPGKLCQALGIEARHDGLDVVPDGRDAVEASRHVDIVITRDHVESPATAIIGPRVGISRAVDVPWRFRVPR